MEKDLRRFLLRPLSRRRQRATIIAALNRLDHRAAGEDFIPRLRDAVKASRNRKTESWRNPKTAAKQVALARALYVSRRISTQEYVYFAVYPVEAVHEGRWFDGHYEADLEPINRAIELVEKMVSLRLRIGLAMKLLRSILVLTISTAPPLPSASLRL